VLLDEMTTENNIINEHKRHKSFGEFTWVYLDTIEDVQPTQIIRVLETRNIKNGLTDYVYDTTWKPNLWPDVEMKQKYLITDRKIPNIDELIALLQNIQKDNVKIEDVESIYQSWKKMQ
jgi:hypothetical protein